MGCNASGTKESLISNFQAHEGQRRAPLSESTTRSRQEKGQCLHTLPVLSCLTEAT